MVRAPVSQKKADVSQPMGAAADFDYTIVDKRDLLAITIWLK